MQTNIFWVSSLAGKMILQVGLCSTMSALNYKEIIEANHFWESMAVIQWNKSVLAAPEAHWLSKWSSSREQSHTQLLLYLAAYPCLRHKQEYSRRKGACLKYPISVPIIVGVCLYIKSQPSIWGADLGFTHQHQGAAGREERWLTTPPSPLTRSMAAKSSYHLLFLQNKLL